MEIKGLFMALLVTGCMVGIIAFYSDLGTRYGVPSSNNLTNISQFENTSNQVNATYKKLTNTSTLFTNTVFGPYIDPIIGFTFASIDVFLMFFQIPFIYLSFITQITTAFNSGGIPIPSWFAGIIISAFILYILIMLIKFLRGSGDF